MKKKVLSILLLICMLCTLVPVGVTADSPAPASYGRVLQGGDCGEGVTWTMYDSGTLLIDGSGNMNSYGEGCLVEKPDGGYTVTNLAPWNSYTARITALVVNNGVGNIGKAAFANCTALASVSLPGSVMSIGAYAFYNCPLLDEIDLPSGVTAIQYNAFQSCGGLLSVHIPKSVSAIGDAAFDVPESIDDVYYGHTQAELASVTFGIGNSRIQSGTIHYNVAAVAGHYSASVTRPSCTEKGYTTYSCPCGYSYVDESSYVDALGHDYTYRVAVDPTLTAMGTLTGSCSRCTSNVSITLPKLSRTAYTYSVTQAPSCTATGTATYTWNKTTYGNIVITVTLAKTNHSYTASVTAPTCTEQGYTTHTCACGASYVDSYVNALGHDWDNGTVTLAPTETSTGIMTYNCTRCVATRTETIPMLSHTHHYSSVVTAPTCTEKGYTTYRCSCGDSYKDNYTDPLGHDFGSWVQTKAPTCTEKGAERRDCSRCDVFEVGDIDATGHHYSSVVTAPTCTEQGYTTYKCSCGDSYKGNYVKALGHNWDNGTVTLPPTETSTGIMTYGCTRCVATRTETIPMLAHTHHYSSVVTAPTCTEKGYTTYTCSCGHSYKDNYTDPLGHNWGDWVQTKAPTCTEKGAERRNCTRCVAFETREVAVIAHTYSAVVTKPSCTEQGFTTHTCSCGASYVGDYVKALGHNFVNNICTRCKLELHPTLDIKNPSTTTVKYGETLVLTANVTDLPAGASVKWSMSGSGGSLSTSGATAYVKCTGSGSVTVSAVIVDQSGNPISGTSDSVSVTMKSNIILKIVSWIKDLFNINRNVYSLVDDGVYIY